MSKEEATKQSSGAVRERVEDYKHREILGYVWDNQRILTDDGGGEFDYCEQMLRKGWLRKEREEPYWKYTLTTAGVEMAVIEDGR